MQVWEAILLGILQGLTEFLPVSSTAHLTIAGRAMGLIDDQRPEAWTAFLAVVQLGTLGAVLWYFRSDLAGMARGDPESRRLGWLVVLGTIPIGIVGFALRDIIEGPLTKDLRVIGVTLIALGLLLGLADRAGRRERPLRALTWKDALLVGAAQVLSLIPGASRAGTTLTGGLFAGLTREAAARFSFLLSIPAIAASGLFELPAALELPREDVAALVVATATAAVFGYLAIAWMLRYLRTQSAAVFVWYRVALGAGVLGAVAAGWV
ncbi:MAG TPA: undecaprenyl-diphosphatase UppP [Candidatus Thermoplasmatota archaeon]|nr:undecaprenyl-diphosphatase UppP [Candidatus Thermoplasmatota archaeon]